MVVEMLEELLEAGVPATDGYPDHEHGPGERAGTSCVSPPWTWPFRSLQGVLRVCKGRGVQPPLSREMRRVERISLHHPSLGVIREMEIEWSIPAAGDGDFVVMVTDGVMDALPVGNQEAMM